MKLVKIKMKCKNGKEVECNCTYPCEKKGNCCECIAFHRKRGELPACYFNKEAEASYDRSVEKFLNQN